MVIRPPVKGRGWFATSGCCKPNVHRDLRVAIDGRRIETAETFAMDWAKVKNNKVFDGDGKKIEQHYGFGEDVLAVANGTVVTIHDGKPDDTPTVDGPGNEGDYGGNNVILEIAPNVFALLCSPAPGEPRGQGRRCSEGRSAHRQDREHRPVRRPPPAFWPSDKPDSIAGRALPFVFDSFAMDGMVDFDTSKGDHW